MRALTPRHYLAVFTAVLMAVAAAFPGQALAKKKNKPSPAPAASPSAEASPSPAPATSPAPAASPSPEASAAPEEKATESTKVWVTKSGKAYHRATCRAIKNRKTTETTLGEAKGKYVPCKLCKPPRL